MYLQYSYFPKDSAEPLTEWCQLGLIDQMEGGYLLNSKGFTLLNFDPKQLIYIGGQWVDLSKFPVRLDYLLQKYGEQNFEISQVIIKRKLYSLSFKKPYNILLEYDGKSCVCTMYSIDKNISDEFVNDLALINVSIGENNE